MHRSSVWQPHFPLEELGEEIGRAICSSKISIVRGPPGAGKSSRVPYQLLAYLTNCQPREYHGILVATDRKEAQNSPFDFMSEDSVFRDHIGIWNGDEGNHQLAGHPSNVTMCALAVFHVHYYPFELIPSLKVFV